MIEKFGESFTNYNKCQTKLSLNVKIFISAHFIVFVSYYKAFLSTPKTRSVCERERGSIIALAWLCDRFMRRHSTVKSQCSFPTTTTTTNKNLFLPSSCCNASKKHKFENRVSNWDKITRPIIFLCPLLSSTSLSEALSKNHPFLFHSITFIFTIFLFLYLLRYSSFYL